MYGHVTAKLVSHQRSVSRCNGLSLEVGLSSEVGLSMQWSLIIGFTVMNMIFVSETLNCQKCIYLQI